MIEPTYEELKAKLAELQKQGPGNAAPATGLWFKVSEKGGASAYGLGRFPVTLYYEQWMRLLAHIDQLRSFLEANKGALKMKKSNEAPC